jgi:hypothetical protein
VADNASLMKAKTKGDMSCVYTHKMTKDWDTWWNQKFLFQRG